MQCNSKIKKVKVKNQQNNISLKVKQKVNKVELMRNMCGKKIKV